MSELTQDEQAARDATREQQTKEAELGRRSRGGTEIRDMSTQESDIARQHRERSAKAEREAKAKPELWTDQQNQEVACAQTRPMDGSASSRAANAARKPDR